MISVKRTKVLWLTADMYYITTSREVSETMKKIKWTDVVRQNTGSHMCDSGGIYGYKYNAPLPKKEISVHVDTKRNEVSVSISLAHYLEETFEIDQELTAWLRSQEVYNYADYALTLKAKLGYGYSNSDYTYNYDNDLDQNFQYSVVSKDEDWIHDDSTYFIVETHNGCDARGGFSDPVVCRNKNSGGNWFDVTAGVCFEEGVDASGKEIDLDVLRSLNERYEIGYCSYPIYEFEKEIEKIVDTYPENGTVRVKLKSGETILVSFYANAGDYFTLSSAA